MEGSWRCSPAFRAGGEPIGHTVPTRCRRHQRPPPYRPRKEEAASGASSHSQRRWRVRCVAAAPHHGPCGLLMAVALAPRLHRRDTNGFAAWAATRDEKVSYTWLKKESNKFSISHNLLSDFSSGNTCSLFGLESRWNRKRGEAVIVL